MKVQEYIEKTSPIVDFLTNCFNSELGLQVIVAQANCNTERLIEMLGLVKGRCEDWIEELKAMEVDKHYYVTKDGRTVSDFGNLDDAKSLAELIDGEIAMEE